MLECHVFRPNIRVQSPHMILRDMRTPKDLCPCGSVRVTSHYSSRVTRPSTRFHARLMSRQRRNKPLEFLVLLGKTRNPRGSCHTHTFVSKVECRWWRWGELNPRPTIGTRVFSGCSSLVVVFGSKVPRERGFDEPIYVRCRPRARSKRVTQWLS